jgi:hypothetical protein
MGEAKRRGTFEQRLAIALARKKTAPVTAPPVETHRPKNYRPNRGKAMLAGFAAMAAMLGSNLAGRRRAK